MQDSETTTVDLKPMRYVLGLSGGKDSAALAIYLKQEGRDDNIGVLLFGYPGQSSRKFMNTWTSSKTF